MAPRRKAASAFPPGTKPPRFRPPKGAEKIGPNFWILNPDVELDYEGIAEELAILVPDPSVLLPPERYPQYYPQYTPPTPEGAR